MKHDYLLSTRQVAERYGVSREQIRQRAAARWRKFPAGEDLDGRRYFDRRQLERWDARNPDFAPQDEEA